MHAPAHTNIVNTRKRAQTFESTREPMNDEASNLERDMHNPAAFQIASALSGDSPVLCHIHSPFSAAAGDHMSGPQSSQLHLRVSYEEPGESCGVPLRDDILHVQHIALLFALARAHRVGAVQPPEEAHCCHVRVGSPREGIRFQVDVAWVERYLVHCWLLDVLYDSFWLLVSCI